MKHFLQATLCFALLGFSVRDAHAQDAAETAAAREPWSLSLGINGSYEGNALFAGPEGDEDFSHHIYAGFGRGWAFRRGSARLSANGNQPFYRKSTSLNDFRYDLAGGLSHAITRRLSWNVASTVTSGLARDSDVLTEAGLVLPSVTARSSNASSTLSYQVSSKSQVDWAVSQTGVGFSSALFRGGSSLGSILSWTRQMNRGHAIGVTQEYQRTFADDESASIYGLLGTWAGAAGRGWMARASAGIRPYTVPDLDGLRMSTGLSASLSKPVGPGRSVGINYDRRVEQTFGLDRTNHLVQTVSANYGLSLSRNVTTAFSGTYSRGSNPVAPDVHITGQTANASLAYRITSNLALSVGSSVYRRTYPPADQVTSYNMFTSLTYGTTW